MPRKKSSGRRAKKNKREKFFLEQCICDYIVETRREIILMNIEVEELTKQIPKCPKCVEIIPKRKFYHKQLHQLKKKLCTFSHAFNLAPISKFTEKNLLMDYGIHACQEATYIQDPHLKIDFKKGVEDEIHTKSKKNNELESNLEEMNKTLKKMSIIEKDCLYLEQTVLFFIQAFEKYEKTKITKWGPEFDNIQEQVIADTAGTTAFLIQKSSTLLTEVVSITQFETNVLTEDDIFLTQKEMAMTIPKQCKYMFNLLKNPKGYISLTNAFYIGHKRFKDKKFRKKMIKEFGKPSKGLNSEAFRKMLSDKFRKYIPEIFAETVITHKARGLKAENLERQYKS